MCGSRVACVVGAKVKMESYCCANKPESELEHKESRGFPKRTSVEGGRIWDPNGAGAASPRKSAREGPTSSTSTPAAACTPYTHSHCPLSRPLALLLYPYSPLYSRRPSRTASRGAIMASFFSSV